MFETIRNAWKIDELRKKILFTLLIIFIFRIGAAIPVPFMIPENLINVTGSGLFEYFDIFTGGAFSQATLFAMSISPYIRLHHPAAVAGHSLWSRWQRREASQKKLAKISRYVTLGPCLHSLPPTT